MTEKRFDILSSHLEMYECFLKTLNELSDENKELKIKVDFYKDFQKEARELEKENEQLKQEIKELETKNESLENKLWNCQNFR